MKRLAIVLFLLIPALAACTAVATVVPAQEPIRQEEEIELTVVGTSWKAWSFLYTNALTRTATFTVWPEDLPEGAQVVSEQLSVDHLEVPPQLKRSLSYEQIVPMAPVLSRILFAEGIGKDPQPNTPTADLQPGEFEESWVLFYYIQFQDSDGNVWHYRPELAEPLEERPDNLSNSYEYLMLQPNDDIWNQYMALDLGTKVRARLGTTAWQDGLEVLYWEVIE